MKNDKCKQQLIEQLKKIPIVQVACERSRVGRATYYRWRNEDKDFRKAADEAIAEGEALITDMSESQVISLIRSKHWPAISFWLKHHHPTYSNRIELITRTAAEEELTPEQQKIVEQALLLAGKSTEKK